MRIFLEIGPLYPWISMVPENAQGSPRPRIHRCQGSVPVIEYLDEWLFSSDLIGRIDLKRGP